VIAHDCPLLFSYGMTSGVCSRRPFWCRSSIHLRISARSNRSALRRPRPTLTWGMYPLQHHRRIVSGLKFVSVATSLTLALYATPPSPPSASDTKKLVTTTSVTSECIWSARVLQLLPNCYLIRSASAFLMPIFCRRDVRRSGPLLPDLWERNILSIYDWGIASCLAHW
jgi:hypothetical protein